MKKWIALLLCALWMLPCALASADYAFATHHIGSTTHPYQLGAEYWSEKLMEYSGGTLSLDIYPANQLASGSKAVEGNQMGTIDICIENPMSVSNIVPAFDALNMPYMFDSAEEAFAVMATEECQVFAEECEKYNLKLLGYWYNGWRNISNSLHPVETVDDLKDMTIRIAESQVFADMMNALGMNAVPLANSEVFTALQMGTVDAQENPQNNYINNKYYEVNRYYSYTMHVFTVEPVTMNLDLWNSLTPEEQEAVQKSFDEAAVYQIELAQQTEETELDQVIAEGADIEVTVIEDLTPFKEATASVIEKYKATDLGPFIEALEAGKEKVAAQNGAAASAETTAEDADTVQAE